MTLDTRKLLVTIITDIFLLEEVNRKVVLYF